VKHNTEALLCESNQYFAC